MVFVCARLRGVSPGGARYIRHVDNSNRNGRKLTVILYLNDDWQPAHGGALRIYRCLVRQAHVLMPLCDRAPGRAGRL